ncbi:MAG: NAD-dependent protein deacylase [Rhodocyclaceae bacterium]|nr:NAD-dependent protein deacylase [Rhodocyclaceae bacterium]CAG0931082.1 NAD-dependent protein deacylase [Rhodocyclaceae bacterium]
MGLLQPGATSMNAVTIPRELIERLAAARRVAVLTGAGISAESGIPTFRDALTGLWANYDPQELATPEGFARNPRLVWDWYAERRARIAAVRPNPGHLALAALERRFEHFTLVTQNIDSLHQRAGSRTVVELHGNIARVKCSREEIVVGDFALDESPPRCHCGAYLRPDVVWFGEMLPAGAMAQAEEAAEHCEVFLSIGTSAQVYPAAELPLRALSSGATVVEINPECTALTRHAHFALQGAAGEVLSQLQEKLASA